MNELKTISRRLLGGLLLVGYLAFSSAGVLHEFSHVARDPMGARCGDTANGGDRKQVPEKSGSFCFFCVHSPVSITPFTPTIATPTAIWPRFVPRHDAPERLIHRIAATYYLRGPPCLA